MRLQRRCCPSGLSSVSVLRLGLRGYLWDGWEDGCGVWWAGGGVGVGKEMERLVLAIEERLVRRPVLERQGKVPVLLEKVLSWVLEVVRPDLDISFIVQA